MRKALIRAASLMTVSVAWASANAHHALSANYTEEVGEIEGVVVEVFWANPHVHYYVEVTEADGSTRTWNLESSNLNGMASAGWTRNTIQVGDRIRVSGRMGRDGRPRLALDRESLEVIE
ncbi:MAG: DUF6152 family protein [Rhodospirillaceae bacterium]|nr:DUF6152 family protein [Rhodospirillaceae bacterium]MDD9998459.1 DUF6152 family protein [Rhodospirillaceae bacterium]MDE0360491.1 DUF6152 family protein [Rhodospirillaceae bacterium]